MPKPTENETKVVEELSRAWWENPICETEPDLVSDERLKKLTKEVLLEVVQRPEVRMLMAVAVTRGGVHGAMKVLTAAIGTHPHFDLIVLAPLIVRLRKQVEDLGEQVASLRAEQGPVDLGL